jgi:tRNA (guanine-N7-)-methyltransferase
MRQRRPKNLDDKIEELNRYLIRNPESLKGNWQSAFQQEGAILDSQADSPKLFLEIGSGKGRFINELALRNKEDNFIGIEGQDTVIIRALEKIRDNELTNLLMCQTYINDFSAFFSGDELDGIYLNFSDPWPKARHEKRRLSSPRYLDGYVKALKSGGLVEMKTDNDDLFSYSVEQFKNHSEFHIVDFTQDLHRSDFSETNIMTEYEKKFMNFGKKINYVSAMKK